MRREEKEFYRELDQDKTKKKEKTLSFWALAGFFLALILIGELVLFWLGRGIRGRPESESAVKGLYNQEVNLGSTSESGSETQTVITQGMLCSKLVENLKQEINCSITPEAIIISGKFSPLLPANSSTYIKPRVEDEKIKFEITKVMIGKISFSKLLASPVNLALSQAINSILPQSSRVISIDLQSALMVIVTSKK